MKRINEADPAGDQKADGIVTASRLSVNPFFYQVGSSQEGFATDSTS
jgi:hypothetical protein